MKFDRIRQTALAVAAAVVTASFGFAGTSAQAATLTFQGKFTKDGKTITYDKDFGRATLTCSISCQGIESWAPDGGFAYPTMDPSSFKGFYAEATGASGTGLSDLFFAEDNSAATTAKFVNSIIPGGGSFTAAQIDAAKDEGNGPGAGGSGFGGLYEFTSSADWLVFKIGKDPDVTVVRNTAGVSQTFTYKQISSEGGGLSSLTELYDDGVIIPEVSATGSVAALGSVFALMAFLFERRGGVSRRRRSVA